MRGWAFVPNVVSSIAPNVVPGVLPGMDIALGPLQLPVWVVAAAAALALFFLMLATRGMGVRGFVALLGRAALILIGLFVAWTLLDRAALHERLADRRALDQRMGELAAHAIAPQSALACLDAMAGDTVEAACEKALFASPEAVAAAVSYVAARLTLLADATAYAEAKDPGYAAVVTPMRLALESDRFGLVAHVFAMRDSCTALQCDALTLLRDTSRVQSNLKERAFDLYIGRYAAEWSNRNASPAVADSGAGGATGSTLASTGSAPAPRGVPLSPGYDFPSAASIPPVSIMNAEPGAPPAAAAPAPKAAAAPARKPAATAPPKPVPAPAPPVQLAPPAAATSGHSLR
jgi:hypothetical protein